MCIIYFHSSFKPFIMENFRNKQKSTSIMKHLFKLFIMEEIFYYGKF
jgi:hypothetical protein